MCLAFTDTAFTALLEESTIPLVNDSNTLPPWAPSSAAEEEGNLMPNAPVNRAKVEAAVEVEDCASADGGVGWGRSDEEGFGGGRGSGESAGCDCESIGKWHVANVRWVRPCVGCDDGGGSWCLVFVVDKTPALCEVEQVSFNAGQSKFFLAN